MALKLALDANRYADFCRGVPEAIGPVRTATHVLLPLIVIGELRCGFRGGTRSRENERRLERFLQQSRVGVLYPDDITTHFYAEIYHELKSAGTPIPANDMWIAALVKQHGAVLFTRDRHFDCVPGLPRI